MAPLPIPRISPIHLADLDSVVVEPSHRASVRLDPFWDPLWNGNSALSWLTRADAERAHGSETVGTYDERTNPTTLLRGLLADNRDFIDSIAAVKMWRNATEDQIAAIAGWIDPSAPAAGKPTRRRRPARPMRHLWRGRIVDVGKFMVAPGASAGMPSIYRVSTDPPARGLFDSLPLTVQHRIADGQPWSSGHRHDRHNLIATELALRLAEHCEVLAVAGEDQATAARLDRSGIAARQRRTTNAGDVLAIRFDGLRIVYEVSCGSSPAQILRKVEKWVEVLSRCTYDHSAVIVCFVEAGAPDGSNRQSVTSIADAILTALAQQPGAAANRLRERFAFVSWPWWFPAAGMVDPSFATLRVLRPTGPATAPWEETHLLDICDVGYFPMDDRQEELAKYTPLGGVPYWLR